MPRKRTTEDIDTAIAHRPIKRIGEYTTISAKIEWECKVCEHRWLANSDNVINKGSGCPKCGRVISANKQRKTLDELLTAIKDRPLNIIGEYVNYDTPTMWSCKTCVHQWMASPNNIISKQSGCPPCSEQLAGLAKSKTCKAEMLDIINAANITLKSTYTRIIDYHDLECNECGYNWNALLSSIKYNNAGCPKCGGSLALTNESVDARLKSDARDIIRLGTIINATTKILWSCNQGHKWSAVPDSVLNGFTGCGKCTRRGWVYAGLRSDPATKDTPCTFYVLRFMNAAETFIKIGLTLRSVRKRFSGYPYTNYNIEVLAEHTNGVDNMVKLERKMLRALISYAVHPQVSKFAGKTECFQDLPEVHAILKEHNLL